MTKATRRRITALIVAVILLALGAGVGVLVGDALGIRTDPATQMSTTPQQPIDAQAAVSARPTSVVAPTDPRTDTAVEALQDVLDHRRWSSQPSVWSSR